MKYGNVLNSEAIHQGCQADKQRQTDKDEDGGPSGVRDSEVFSLSWKVTV
jgi:hypothetical protein